MLLYSSIFFASVVSASVIGGTETTEGTEVTSSISEESTEEIRTSREYLDPTDYVAAQLRNRAKIQILNPLENHSDEAFCEGNEEQLVEILTRDIEINDFMKMICPQFWAQNRLFRKAVLKRIGVCPSMTSKFVIVEIENIFESVLFELGGTGFDSNHCVYFQSRPRGAADVMTAFARELSNDDYMFEFDGELLTLPERNSKALSWYTSFGKFLGIAALRQEKIPLPISLPLAYYARLLERPTEQDDVKIDAMRVGFQQVTTQSALEFMFPSELRAMIEGEAVTNYPRKLIVTSLSWSKARGVSDAEYGQVLYWFISFVYELGEDEYREFLHFVTGSNRLPFDNIENYMARFGFEMYRAENDGIPIVPKTQPNRFGDVTFGLPLYSTEQVFIREMYKTIGRDRCGGTSERST